MKGNRNAEPALRHPILFGLQYSLRPAIHVMPEFWRHGAAQSHGWPNAKRYGRIRRREGALSCRSNTTPQNVSVHLIARTRFESIVDVFDGFTWCAVTTGRLMACLDGRCRCLSGHDIDTKGAPEARTDEATCLAPPRPRRDRQFQGGRPWLAKPDQRSVAKGGRALAPFLRSPARAVPGMPAARSPPPSSSIGARNRGRLAHASGRAP